MSYYIGKLTVTAKKDFLSFYCEKEDCFGAKRFGTAYPTEQAVIDATCNLSGRSFFFEKRLVDGDDIILVYRMWR